MPSSGVQEMSEVKEVIAEAEGLRGMLGDVDASTEIAAMEAKYPPPTALKLSNGLPVCRLGTVCYTEKLWTLHSIGENLVSQGKCLSAASAVPTSRSCGGFEHTIPTYSSGYCITTT